MTNRNTYNPSRLEWAAIAASTAAMTAVGPIAVALTAVGATGGVMASKVLGWPGNDDRDTLDESRT